MVRALVKKAVAGCEEYVNPWKIPTFDLNGPLCFYMAAKEHVIFGFMRGAMLRDPGKLLEGTGKYLRHVKLRSAADVRRSEVRALLEQAAKLNRKEPVTGTKVQMKQSRAAGTRKSGQDSKIIALIGPLLLLKESFWMSNFLRTRPGQKRDTKSVPAGRLPRV